MKNISKDSTAINDSTEKNTEVSSSVNRSVRASGFYNFFRSYYKSERSFSKSVTGGFTSSERLGALIKLFKNNFSRNCENSLIVNAISSFYDKLLNSSIRSYAILSLYFGVYTLIIEVIRASLSGVFNIIPDNVYYASILIIISLLFLFVKTPLCGFVDESKVLSFISDKIFIKSYARKSSKEVFYPSNGILILLGTLLGISTIIFPVADILLFVISAFLVLSFFRAPENSLPVLIVTCPFLPQNFFAFLCVASFAAYLFKALRGKRNFSLKYFDVLVIILFLIIIAGGFGSGNRHIFGIETATMLSVCLIYFSMRNCIRDEIQCKKIAYSFVTCALISSLILIYGKIHSLGYFSFVEKNSLLRLNAAPIDPFGDKIVYGEFLLVFLPFVLMSSLVASKYTGKIAGILSIASCAAALVFTDSKGILIAFGICLLIYITSSFKNPFAALITILSVYVVAWIFVTQSPFLGEDRFFSVHGYKEMIRDSSLNVALDNFIGGIGFGKQNFAQVFKLYNGFAAGNISSCYNMYLQFLIQTGVFGFIYFIIVSVNYFKMQFSSLSDSKRKNSFSSLVAISSISSVGTLFVRGLTNSVWNDHRVLFAFFAVIGLSAAVYYFNDNDSNTYKED